MNSATQSPESLFAENVKLVQFVLNRQAVTGTDREDFFQEGLLALWKAAQTFQPDKGCKFSSYALNRIQWRFLRYYRCRYYPQKNDIPTEEAELIRLGGSVSSEVILLELEEVKQKLTVLESQLLNFLLEEKTFSEIGEHYGLTRQAIHKRVCALRLKMKGLNQ